MRVVAAITLGLSLCGTASAHDMWLQPQSWQVAPGKALPFGIEVGHGPSRQQWGVGRTNVVVFRDIAHGGAVDIRPLFKPGGQVPHLTRTFRREGLHIISLVSTNAASNLPAIRFNDYLTTEGLSPAIDARQRAGMMNANGRELYSRRAKALIQVGRPTAHDNALATRPIGLTLEIVPLRNPYSPAADNILPVQILFEGRPLSGALVKLTNLEFDAKPVEMIRSDSTGRVKFKLPPVGSWLVNVIWTQPVSMPTADYMTTFSSLTFGYPAKRSR